MGEFVHLHTHTAYSLLDGACRIDKLIARAKELGQTALAITDHGVMYGVVDFYKEAKKQGMKPILGCEVYIAARNLFDKNYEYDRYRSHLILLAKDQTGYRNLMKLVSIGHLEGFYIKPRIDKQVLRQHSQGLICLSACVAGEIPKAILDNDLAQARLLIEEYLGIFGKDNFFLELQNHGTLEEAKVASQLVTLAREYGIGVVATNDVHYVNKRDAEFQDILMCIQTGKTVHETDRMKFDTQELYLKSGEEMAALFPTLPEAISNTAAIAERCNVELEFGNYHLPSFPLEQNRDPFEYLKELCFEGLQKRYNSITDELTGRLNYELDTIRTMGFVDYFLIVWDFIRYAKDHGIVVGPGRGSAAGSLVAYCLAITDVDPIQYQLMFERFLNPERITMPDIDIDFCVERRGEVLDYVVQKYGKDKVAQIITFGTLSARSVIRDVGRALDVPYGTVDTVAKLVPFKLGQTIDNALKERKLKEIYDTDATVRRLIDCARELEGLPRHASTHAAGVVITKNTLSDYVPLQLSDETVITQFPMTTLEELGLLKMDFLGLRNLTILKDALEDIGDPSLTMDTMEEDNPKVYALISRGDTDGVFQLESRGMKAFMRELKPTCIEDLIAGISLYRPGPADSIPRYVACKNDPTQIEYKHPMLEPILQSTYGCIVYQEQVMQIVQQMAGYSLSRADLLRRAMGKKKPEVIQKEEQSFIFGDDQVDGAVKRGVPEEVARAIFGEMAEFGKYAFNKSHAAAYAKIAYQTAYLKALYPVPFMCALMSSQLYDTAKITQYINQLAGMGIRLLPPDINKSFARFTSEDGAIRFGLGAAKNVGVGMVDQLVAERKKGPFVSLMDFCTRMQEHGLNKRALEALIRAGAFDGLPGSRSQYLAVFEKTLERAQEQNRYGFAGQLSLLGDEPAGQQDDLPELAEFSRDDLLAMEKEVLGVYVSGHPLHRYQKAIESHSQYPIAQLLAAEEGEEGPADGHTVTLAGIITAKKRKYTKRDAEMAFLTLEDLSGSIEVIVFPQAFARYETMLVEEQVICITGRLDVKEDEPPKLILERAALVPQNGGKKLYIKLPPRYQPLLNGLKELLKIHSGPVPVYLFDPAAKKTMAADKSLWVEPGDVLYRQLEQLLGPDSDVKLVE